jgi:hypothetical protein
MADNISSGLKVGVTMCVVVAIISTLLLIFQLGKAVVRQYVTDTAESTSALHSGEVGSMDAFVDSVQVPMIYNALNRSGDNWANIELYDNSSYPTISSTSADSLLNYFNRKGYVTIDNETVIIRLEPAT